jgi:hypothetical protein
MPGPWLYRGGGGGMTILPIGGPCIGADMGGGGGGGGKPLLLGSLEETCRWPAGYMLDDTYCGSNSLVVGSWAPGR